MKNTTVDSIAAFDMQELVALAKLDIENSNIDSALLKIKQGLSLEKDNADILSIAGKVYAQLGLFDKAVDCFDRYLIKNPESVVEKFQLGMVKFDMGNSDEAVSIWDELLAVQPTHPPALFYKGLVQVQSGSVANARNTLSILLQSAPADNLYFGRAKELLESIDKGVTVESATAGSGSANAGVMKKDAYKVIN